MNEAKKTVEEINAWARTQTWCDFEIVELLHSSLTIQGSISTSFPFDIRIHFEEVFHVQCNSDWKSDTRSDILQVDESEEARELNLRYQVEMGHHIFKIVPEDLNCCFFVIAKGISFELPKR